VLENINILSSKLHIILEIGLVIVCITLGLLWGQVRKQSQTFKRLMHLLRQRPVDDQHREREGYRALVHESNSIILCMNPKGQITFINKYAQDLFGYTEEELIGKNLIGTLTPEIESSGRNLTNLIKNIRNDPEKYTEYENENIKKNGETIWVNWSNKAVYDTQGNIKEIRSIGNDITSRKKLEEDLRVMASIDQLTGVLNRRRLIEISQVEFKKCQKTNQKLALLLIDIDRFKRVNDLYGHAVGDKALQNVATLCNKSLRKSDYMGRLGGEEFAILFPQTSLNEAEKMAERLRKSIEKAPINIEEQKIKLTISIGVAAYKKEDEDITVLINRADQAMYQAKRSGRNRVVSEEEIDSKITL